MNVYKKSVIKIVFFGLLFSLTQPMLAMDKKDSSASTITTFIKSGLGIVGIVILYKLYEHFNKRLPGTYINGVRYEGNVIITNNMIFNKAKQKYQEKSAETRKNKDFVNLTIKNTCGSISVKAWNKDEISIEVEKKAEQEEDLKKLIFSINETENEFKITSLWDAQAIKNATINYIIKVPETLKNSDLTTSCDTITLKDLQGNHKLRNSCGGIEVENSEDVDAQESNGDIMLKKIGKVLVKNSNGYTTIENAGDVTGSSSNGNACFNKVGNVDYATSNGKIVLDGALDATLSSANGNIFVENTFGNFYLNTTNGKISVKNAKTKKWMTNSSMGNTELTHVTGDGNATSNMGNINFSYCTGTNSGKTNMGNVYITNSPNTSGETTMGKVKNY